MERQLLQDLSQYYPLRQGQSGWSRQSLLSLSKHVIAQHTMTFHLPEFFSVVKDLEDLSALPGPSNRPDS